MMDTKKVTPILVVLLKGDLCEHDDHIIFEASVSELDRSIKNAGWLSLIIDGAEYTKVEAFGLDKADLPKFEELKKTVDSVLKTLKIAV